MSRVKDDPSKEEILNALTQILMDTNNKMLSANKDTKLPTLIELGEQLREVFNREKPFSNHAISSYMKALGYKSNRKTRQFEKEKTFNINGYVGEPSFVYIHISCDEDRKKIKEWSTYNFPNTFVDTINTDNGIIIIGNTDIFARIFTHRYDKYAKENNVKLITSNLEEPSL